MGGVDTPRPEPIPFRRDRLDDTIAAIATAPGQGAIGIVRVAGPAAHAIAGALFRPASQRTINAEAAGRFMFGRVIDPDSGEVIDEGLLLLFAAPHSYTGQDAIELQLHGGPALLRTVLARVLALGARTAEPGEFTLRAVMAGRLDLNQAEAVLGLIEAKSEAARRQASQGLSGALSQALSDAQATLMGLYAEVLAPLDYPEEGVPEAHIAAPLERVRAILQRLLATADAGRYAQQGARLAIVGRPNAGKSSLLNALLGYPRALVSDTPGTTRDYLEAPLELGRVSVTAIDTAGLRTTADAVEAAGVEQARAIAHAADVVVALIDSSQPLTADDHALLAYLPRERSVWVASKVDRERVWSDHDLGVACLPVSSSTGFGLEALRAMLEAKLVGDAAGEILWLSSERVMDALREALDALERVPNAPLDLQALDLETALRALARATGRGDIAEATLDQVFARFCVGK